MVALRYAFRSLSRSPGFVAVAILALGLGLGLATTMFGIMDAVVHPYLPYRDPGELVNLSWRLPRRATVSGADVLQAMRRIDAIAVVVPLAYETQPLEMGERSAEIGVARVTPEYFATMGVRPRLGRVLAESDAPETAVLSQGLWRKLYGLRRSVAGATIRLGDITYRVAGVLPEGATHPLGAQAWTPLPPDWQLRGQAFALARLKPGINDGTIATQLVALAKQLSDRLLDTATAREGRIAFNVTRVQQTGEELSDIHFAMVGASVVVLLIACANLAHLMLARGFAKRRELAVRMAIGAGRGTIVRQMFTECAIITACGAALGALVALWGADVIANRMPADVAWVGLVRPHLSWRVFATGAAAAITAAIVFGLVPAVGVALDVSLDEPLKDGAGTTAKQRHRYSPLVIFEVAIALVLVMAGSLLIRSVREAQRHQLGFRTEELMSGLVYVNRCALDSTLTLCRIQHGRWGAHGMHTTHEEILTALRSAPGVADVAFESQGVPKGGLVTAEQTGDSTRTVFFQYYRVVSPSYLRTVGLPVLRGRDFEPGDLARPGGAAIIDPVLALQLYPHDDPVGHMVKLGSPSSTAPWVPIIGVARNPSVLDPASDAPPAPAIWVAAPPVKNSFMFEQVVIRALPGHVARAGVALKRAMTGVPGVYNIRVEPHAATQNAVLHSRRFLSSVFVTLGLVALALAGLGLYGVLAFAVGQRMREFAIRLALGAASRDVGRMVAHDAAVMILAGTGIGAFISLAATRYIDAVLSGVYRTDAVSLVIAELLLFLVGSAAAFAPARRAVSANPLDIIRAV